MTFCGTRTIGYTVWLCILQHEPEDERHVYVSTAPTATTATTEERS